MAMILVSGIQGSTTFVSLSSSSPSLSCSLGRNPPDPSSHSLFVAKIPLPKGKSLRCVNRWQCRYSSITAPTDFLSEHTKPASLDSNYDGSTGEPGISLKPAPRPVVRPPFVPKTDSVLSEPPSPPGVLTSDRLDNLEDRNSLIESLDDVLEKAERLEKSKLSEGSGKAENGPVNRSASSNTNANLKRVQPQNPEEGKKAKTVKSVWRKGDTVGSVQKVKFVKDTPTSNKAEESKRAQLDPRVSFRPANPPFRPQPQLQARPSVAPPPLKRPVIMKDVGAATKPPPLDDSDAAGKGKERKPILVDKFATKKKPVVDPLIARAVLAPTKLPKGPPGKFKDDYRKKNASAGAPRRRIIDDDNDVEIHDEDTSELNVTIPGAVTARKGRKWSKATRKAARLQAAKDAAPVKVEILEVCEKGMLIEDLAYNLATSEGEILGLLYSKGIRPDGVQTLDKDMVKMVCKQYEVEVIDVDPLKVEEMAKKKEIFDEEDLDKLEDRPPVLTIMGHVDHGKTTLLDYIRKSKVAASEAGGITQGIGAYKVLVPVDGTLQPCVFLDTPGHEAFGAMRARGARVTDIAIIVVAADDGIRPQTNEAIAHAKAAGVPIVIAINKIDKDGASPERVMQELSSIGLMPEDWGGDIPMVQISALKGENIDELLETTMLVSELQELKANPHRNAKGTVIEAGLQKAKGPTATFIVQNGTLKKGDVVVCGEAFGKVRALFDNSGRQVNEAGPSIPVQVIGLNNVPIAGDEFEVVDSLDIAREKAEARAESLRNERISAKAGDGKVTLSSLASAVSSGKLSGLDLHQLNIVMKVDVQGSIEAIRQALQVLPQENVSLKFLLQAPGDISTSDVDLAVAGKAIIIGFNVKVPGSVQSYADNKGVEIRTYRVIYELIDDVRNAMEGLLEPVEEQETIGFAEVRAIFSSGSGRAAGCMVTEGKVVKGCGIRVLRNSKTVFVGMLDSLRRVKEAVKEVTVGLECGIGVEDFDDWEEGDVVEAYTTVEKRRTLEEASASMAAALEGVGIKL